MAQLESRQKRQRNQRGEGSRLKDELIEASMRLLDARPGVQLSLRMVAKEAGVTPPSVYRHFPDVEAMLIAVGLECWASLAHEMNKAATKVTQEELLTSLKAKMSAYVYYAMERPSRYQLLFDFAGGFEHDIDGPIRPAYRAVLKTIKAISDRGLRVPGNDPTKAAILVLSIAHGRIALAHLAPQRPGNHTAGVEAFVLEMLDEIFAR